MKKIIRGSGSPVVGIVGCLHGNEKIGHEAINLLKRIIPKKGTLIFILANQEAMKQNKRFIDSDLNRCFPGKKNGNHEEKLAQPMLKSLSGCDYVIDIHSTTADTENFVIMTKCDEQTKSLATYLLLNKAVIMGNALAGGKSLIDHVSCGISIEFNFKTKPESVSGIIINCLRNLNMLDGPIYITDPEIYLAYGILRKLIHSNVPELANFRQASIGGELFYPILFGEKAYSGSLCLKARKLKDSKSHLP